MVARGMAGLVAMACWAGAVGAARGAEAPKKETFVAVFDFACAGNDKYGKELANVVRLRLARHKDLRVIDRFTVAEFSVPLGAAADPAVVVRLMTERLACNIGVYGTATKNGHDVHLELCGIDLRGGKKKVWKKKLNDATERYNAVITKAVVEQITGKAEWVPPEYGDEDEPKKFAPPLNVNGSFDEGGHKGWQEPDNVASFIERGPPGRGNILRVRTDLERWPYIHYIRAIRMGTASPKRPPKIGTDSSMGGLGGFEGVHFKSDWIKATPGRRYWLAADYNPGGKVFLKGFKKTEHALDGMPESALAKLKMTPEQFARLPEARQKKLIAQAAKRQPKNFLRECYRWYLNCRGGGGWTHLAAPVPPRGGLPDYVEWFQIHVYSYWPAGTYRYDNVFLYKDPRQKAPLPEVKAMTPNFGKTSDVVEKETAEKEKRNKPK